MEETNDFQVRVVVEWLDKDGQVIEEVSDQILKEFSNDETNDTIGEKSDNYFHSVINQCKYISY